MVCVFPSFQFIPTGNTDYLLSLHPKWFGKYDHFVARLKNSSRIYSSRFGSANACAQCPPRRQQSAILQHYALQALVSVLRSLAAALPAMEAVEAADPLHTPNPGPLTLLPSPSFWHLRLFSLTFAFNPSQPHPPASEIAPPPQKNLTPSCS